MSIKVYTTQSYKGFDLMKSLDDKGVPYEVCEPTMGWLEEHKVKALPVMVVDGKILDYRKSLKWIKKQR